MLLHNRSCSHDRSRLVEHRLLRLLEMINVTSKILKILSTTYFDNPDIRWTSRTFRCLYSSLTLRCKCSSAHKSLCNRELHADRHRWGRSASCTSRNTRSTDNLCQVEFFYASQKSLHKRILYLPTSWPELEQLKHANTNNTKHKFINECIPTIRSLLKNWTGFWKIYVSEESLRVFQIASRGLHVKILGASVWVAFVYRWYW